MRPDLRMLAAGAALVCLLFAASAPATHAAEPKNPVIAIVNGEKITLSELRAFHQEFPQQRVRAIPLARIYRPLLELMIQIRLVAAEGRKANLQDDAEIKRRVASYTNRLLREVYLSRFVDKQITDEKLQAEYDGFRKSFKGQEEIRASHILVKTKKEAMAVIEELEKGGKFAEVAKSKSIGPSKSRGGDLGWFVKKQMVKPFADAAFALKKGELSKTPVQTQFGWHVILLTDRRTQQAPKFGAVKGKLREKLAQKLMRGEVERVTKDAKIERFNPDGSPMAADKK